MNNEERFIDIETALACLQKTVDELNEVVIAQQKEIEHLRKSNMFLLEVIKTDSVKSLSEETPPPHY